MWRRKKLKNHMTSDIRDLTCQSRISSLTEKTAGIRTFTFKHSNIFMLARREQRSHHGNGSDSHFLSFSVYTGLQNKTFESPESQKS